MTEQHQSLTMTISRGIVAIYKDEFGRGPSRARTFLDDDVLTVVLEDSLTGMESTLVAHGEEDVVNQMRDGFQAVTCNRMVALVEQETGRSVKAFMSDHSVLPDYAVEVFVLEARGSSDSEPC